MQDAFADVLSLEGRFIHRPADPPAPSLAEG